jgi:hypothetical protein
MTNASDLRQLNQLRELASSYGVDLVCSTTTYENLSLIPMTNSDGFTFFPLYSRDIEFVSGDCNQLFCYLRGWEHAMRYSSMCIKNFDSKIDKAEEAYRHKRLMNLMANNNDDD